MKEHGKQRKDEEEKNVMEQSVETAWEGTGECTSVMETVETIDGVRDTDTNNDPIAEPVLCTAVG